MHAHARVCEENKLELEEKNNAYWINFAVKGASLKDHIGRVGIQRHIKMILSRIAHHSITVLYCTKLNSNLHVSRVLALVTEMSVKTHGLVGS